MATTTMSTATSIDGTATVAPTAPSRAPRTAKPTIRPTMNTALGRRRVTSDPSSAPGRAA